MNYQQYKVSWDKVRVDNDPDLVLEYDDVNKAFPIDKATFDILMAIVSSMPQGSVLRSSDVTLRKLPSGNLSISSGLDVRVSRMMDL